MITQSQIPIDTKKLRPLQSTNLCKAKDRIDYTHPQVQSILTEYFKDFFPAIIETENGLAYDVSALGGFSRKVKVVPANSIQDIPKGEIMRMLESWIKLRQYVQTSNLSNEVKSILLNLKIPDPKCSLQYYLLEKIDTSHRLIILWGYESEKEPAVTVEEALSNLLQVAKKNLQSMLVTAMVPTLATAQVPLYQEKKTQSSKFSLPLVAGGLMLLSLLALAIFLVVKITNTPASPSSAEIAIDDIDLSEFGNEKEIIPHQNQSSKTSETIHIKIQNQKPHEANSPHGMDIGSIEKPEKNQLGSDKIPNTKSMNLDAMHAKNSSPKPREASSSNVIDLSSMHASRKNKASDNKAAGTGALNLDAMHAKNSSLKAREASSSNAIDLSSMHASRKNKASNNKAAGTGALNLDAMHAKNPSPKPREASSSNAIDLSSMHASRKNNKASNNKAAGTGALSLDAMHSKNSSPKPREASSSNVIDLSSMHASRKNKASDNKAAGTGALNLDAMHAKNTKKKPSKENSSGKINLDAMHTKKKP